MSDEDESELELTVAQSAALLKLEVRLLNLAETSYTRLQPDGNIESHAKQEATGIVADLRGIIEEHELPFEIYESLTESYVGKLRDNFRSTVVEAALEGQGGLNRERARKVEYLSSLYVEVLGIFQAKEAQRQEGLEKIGIVYNGMQLYASDIKDHPVCISIEDGDAEVSRLVKTYNISTRDFIEVIRDYIADTGQGPIWHTMNMIRQAISQVNRLENPSPDELRYKKLEESKLAEYKRLNDYLTNKLKSLENPPHT